MKKSTLNTALFLAGLISLPAMAHVSYTNRDLGTFSGLSAASNSITNQTTYNFGWADAADTDWGDSHKGKWYKFTLGNAADVTLTASANATATPASIGGLLPAFSLYQGLAPSAAYDTSAVSLTYRASLGFPTEGSLNALGSFKIGNDAGTISQLTFVGYAADEGVADGLVSKTFALGAGSYSLWIGGANYAGQFSPLPLNTYGVTASIGIAPVPEPETYAMLLAGLGLIGAIARRRTPKAA
ncbi:MAG: FxDxF family PEP-CTERM protein [Azonexus sp.]|nr:FxDxF family PEP-CTERM protein [Azonexus sp.]